WEGAGMRPRLPSNRPNWAIRGRLLPTTSRHLPGAWTPPNHNAPISLYRLRYQMPREEKNYATALIFLNKIVELDPMDLEAKLCKGEIYHRCLKDYSNAIDQYNKVIRLTTDSNHAINTRARAAMAEIMELLS